MKARGFDWETRSACDLLNSGTYKYAVDPTTQAICCSFLMPNGEVASWWPEWVTRAIDEEPEYLPYTLGFGASESAQRKLYTGHYSAWHSAFDRLIWQYVAANDYGFPQTKTEQWICTASLARANGLPGKLEDAAKALGITQQKDARGKELIKLLSIPNGGTRWQPEFNEDPKLLREMIEYCEQDVRTEAGMVEMMRGFLDFELRDFFVSERINDRGVGADIDFAKKAVTFAETEMRVLEDQLQDVTAGEVERPTQYQRVKNWLLQGYIATPDEDGKGDRYLPDPHDMQRINPEAVKQMTVYKKGQRKVSLDKAVRHNLLSLYDEDPRILTPEALEVIQLTDLAGRSSTAKYKKMVQREIDGRLHGVYVFSGAQSTGRFSSITPQLHNMVRDCVDDFDESLAALESMEDTQAIHTLARMMRPTIQAKDGKLLYWSDWSNIEGRGLPYLANSQSAIDKLELFDYLDNNPDEPDIYERMAARLSLKGKDSRQSGKVIELSFGFGGGVGACMAMARNYGVRVTEAKAKDYQKQWRIANPWAEPFWYALKDAAWNAIVTPEEFFAAGRVKYFYTPDTHNGLGTLWCQLPSGRLLSYVAPRFEQVPTPWNPEQTMTELTCLKANWKPKAGDTEWPRYKLWYGVLAENVTQAFCNDILREALARCEEHTLDVVAHTHDEVVAEDEDDVGELLQWVMQRSPDWVDGFLPLVADIHSGPRYSK